ncbi:MAG: aminoacyl-histidine dipeptidase [Acutalibacteraceae bacterium]|nr:aminoacyl-histidine dipeptidase [Acutalibacteraceae bacterium]
MRILDGLKPDKVFEYFENISAIPRGSHNTEKIRNYCVKFAEERNLNYKTDDAGNIVIYKPACNSESTEPVIIQGHLDMVWEKNDSSNINFETDGLELIVEDDFIRANGTTLGGDDGIAVAMGLALLDSKDISHPPLEVLFTADEEVGMSGAEGLDSSILNGKRMINLDSEAEDVLWVSCAGGVRADINFNASFIPNTKNAYTITVSGLHGGHSGAEIHKGYANANKVMGKLLSKVLKKCSFDICSINGGTMDNAITRECVCVISSDENVCDIISDIYEGFINEYKINDPEIKISVSKSEKYMKSMDSEFTKAFITFLNELPSGVISMSKDIEGLVETSLNLGKLKTEDDNISFVFSLRSGKDTEKAKLCNVISEICKNHNCEISFRSSYPAWEYKKESMLRDTMISVYREMYGKELKVTAIHAGLECGIFCGKIDGLDCVSLGPDMYDIHTPEERLSISSCRRVWEFLLRVLEII